MDERTYAWVIPGVHGVVAVVDAKDPSGHNYSLLVAVHLHFVTNREKNRGNLDRRVLAV
jgi:hypothetical protein